MLKKKSQKPIPLTGEQYPSGQLDQRYVVEERAQLSPVARVARRQLHGDALRRVGGAVVRVSDQVQVTDQRRRPATGRYSLVIGYVSKYLLGRKQIP